MSVCHNDDLHQMPCGAAHFQSLRGCGALARLTKGVRCLYSGDLAVSETVVSF